MPWRACRPRRPKTQVTLLAFTVVLATVLGFAVPIIEGQVRRTVEAAGAEAAGLAQRVPEAGALRTGLWRAAVIEGILAGAIGALLIGLLLTRPIRRIEDAARFVEQPAPRRAARIAASPCCRDVEALGQAQKMEAMGRLAAGVAHEFNNLLTAIGGFARVLKRHVEDPKTVESWADDIIAACEQGASLTKSMLDFSHREPPNPSVVRLSEILRRTETLVRPTIGDTISVRFEVEDPNLAVHVDCERFTQALLSLLVNAKDAMPEGGKLVVGARVADLDRGAIAGLEIVDPGSYVAVSVADTGVGMDADTIKHIFEPFFTTKDFGKGSGLGLALVYRFVQDSRGAIAVDSTPGAGTTFTLYFPVVRLPEDPVHEVPAIPLSATT